MKEPSTSTIGKRPKSSAGSAAGAFAAARCKPAVFLAAALIACFLAEFTVGAQAFRSQFTQVRATVPVGSTNTTILGGSYYTNNTVILVNGVTNANFDVTGLPAGAAATFMDGFGNPLPFATQSTNLQIVLNTTNIPEGIYNFTLNIGGLDTNGLPVTNQFPLFCKRRTSGWAGTGRDGICREQQLVNRDQLARRLAGGHGRRGHC